MQRRRLRCLGPGRGGYFTHNLTGAVSASCALAIGWLGNRGLRAFAVLVWAVAVEGRWCLCAIAKSLEQQRDHPLAWPAASHDQRHSGSCGAQQVTGVDVRAKFAGPRGTRGRPRKVRDLGLGGVCRNHRSSAASTTEGEPMLSRTHRASA